MGVVQRQTVKTSILRYLGLGLGMLSSIFIYPFSIDLYGFISFIQDTAMLILPFTLLGVPQAGLKFFPYFRDPNKKHHDFLSFTLSIGLFGALVIGGLLLIFNEEIVQYYFASYENESWLSFGLVIKIILLLFFLNAKQVFQTYCNNHQRVAIQSLMELALKVGLPLIVIGHLSLGWSFEFCLNLFIGIHFFSILGYMLYIRNMGSWYIGRSFIPFIKKEKILKPYVQFSLYSIIGGLSTLVIARVDTVMVGALSDLDTTGVYKISIIIANIVLIPFLAISQVVVPIISNHLKNEDYKEVGVLYKDIGIASLIVGIFFSVGILEGIDIFYLTHPKGALLKEGYIVIFYTIITALINMATSVNGWILSMSKFYKINLWITVSMAIFNTILNYLLIKEMGVVGVAIATLISILLMNSINLSIVYRKFKIHPFHINSLYLLGFSALVYFPIFWLLPAQENLMLKLLYLSLFTVVYLFGIYKMKLSENVNDGMDKILSLFRRKNK
jgi:O-antigen/teichoic acid export membrane protein